MEENGIRVTGLEEKRGEGWVYIIIFNLEDNRCG